MTKDYAIMLLKDVDAKLKELEDSSCWFDNDTPRTDGWFRGVASAHIRSASAGAASALSYLELSKKRAEDGQ
jgi:hypothetical protein